MSGSTTELNLKTAVDADDTADYLTLSLADSLRTVDALFNNTSGHNHGGAHQGGPLAAGTIGADQLADGAVTTPKLADRAVTGIKLETPLSVSGPAGIAGDLTVSANASVLGGTLTVGQAAGAQGQLLLLHPNGHISHFRGGPSGLELTNNANSAVIANWDDVGSAVFGGNLTLSTAVSTSITFGDAQMIAVGSTYIQTNGKLALGVGANGYRLVLPNIADGNGQGIANAWQVHSCIDHARQYNLNVQSITDPLGKVSAIQGYYYDHINFDAEGAPMTDEGGVPQSAPMYGFAPSEVEPILPEMVAHDDNGEAIGVDYSRMVIVLWEAVRELGTRLTALEAPE